MRQKEDFQNRNTFEIGDIKHFYSFNILKHMCYFQIVDKEHIQNMDDWFYDEGEAREGVSVAKVGTKYDFPLSFGLFLGPF